jgi:hypothetical protein
MDKYVITDQLVRQVDNRKVLAAVFTTYTFEPDFFELDVIPVLLPSGISYSADDRVKTFQVREALRESGLELEVFYDLPMFRASTETSPNMEYLCHGVKYNRGVFHAKNIYLLVKHPETEAISLLLAAGSNNLTRAGWWENIEAQHWLEIKSGQYPTPFIQQLVDEIDMLLQKRSLMAPASALEKIHDYLKSCKANERGEKVFYFGINSDDFFEFIAQTAKSTLARHKNWALEIISPFFAENTQNELHRFFLDHMGVNTIVMLLPTDQEGTALCELAYYQHIKKSDHIIWGKWHPALARALGITGDLFRNVHAKIFHFYNDREAWVFVGSVNFSHKAIHDNIESGFFVKLNQRVPLLEALAETDQIERFKNKLESEPNGDNEEETSELPELHLKYDWITKTLTARTGPGKRILLDVVNSERKSIIDAWLLTETESIKYDVRCLETLLQQGSLVLVSGSNADTGIRFPEHKILLQQTSWSHKPLDLPSLTAEQILAIYAGMNPERRMMMLLNAKVHALVLKNIGGEITADQDDAMHQQFFCEFAEIFHAFRTLKKRLHTALEYKEFKQLDYYLTGKGVDSLPSLLNQKDYANPVIYYLLLLSAKEIYEDVGFQLRPKVVEQVQNVDELLMALKSGDAIILEENTAEKRQRFFEWYEAQFFRQYSAQINTDKG